MYKMNSCMYPYAHTNNPSVKWDLICEVLHVKRIVQSLSHVQLFVILWTTTCQAPLPSPKPRAYANSCL